MSVSADAGIFYSIGAIDKKNKGLGVIAMKSKRNKVAPVKKVGKDFCGVCELRQLPKGVYFRVVDKNGKVSKETYTKGGYDYGTKTFECAKHSDIWGNGRCVKGTQKVTTDFIY